MTLCPTHQRSRGSAISGFAASNPFVRDLVLLYLRVSRAVAQCASRSEKFDGHGERRPGIQPSTYKASAPA